MGVQLSGGSFFIGGIIQGKIFKRQGYRGQLPCGEFYGGNSPGENYSGVIVWGAKVFGGVNDLEGFYRGKLPGG